MHQATHFTPGPGAGALARSRLYLQLSTLFRYPTLALYEKLINGKYLCELSETLEACPHQHGPYVDEFIKLSIEIQGSLTGLDYLKYEVLFTETFEVGAPQPPCPPYEGLQRKAIPRNATMLNIMAFYKHFGLDMDKGEKIHELPDHISAELEFLHFLTFKEAQAREEVDMESLSGYILAQHDFLKRHLLAWVSGFASKIEALKSDNILAAWAKLTTTFLLVEMDFISTYLKEKGIDTTPFDISDQTPVAFISDEELAPACIACIEADPE